MSDFDLVVLGDIVLPSGVVPDGHVAVREGRIARVGCGLAPSARDRIDARGCLVMPGAIDGQTHSRSQKGQEDFIWSTRSAAAGGVTTIVDMPYDAGNLICNAERLRKKAQEAGQQARVDFALYGTVHPQDGPTHIAEMVEAGACGFKFSTFGTDPERFPRIAPQVLHACFAEIARHGLVAGVHNEDDEIVKALVRQMREQGVTDYTAHTRSRPVYSETLAINQIYELAADTGCRGHVVHCSTARGYELCEAYRRQGYRTTIEACVHYLVLSEEDDVSRLGGKAKVNPPIRGRAEREAIWRHLAAGQVDLVSTDHVSWAEDRKTLPNMLDNASGATGLDALQVLLLTGLKRRGLPLHLAARVLAQGPARLFGLGQRKGALTEGCDADIAILKPTRWTYDPARHGNNFVSWSPYDGQLLDYEVAATYLRGTLVFDGMHVLAEPGFGKFVTPLP
jgi:allantoinase